MISLIYSQTKELVGLIHASPNNVRFAVFSQYFASPGPRLREAAIRQPRPSLNYVRERERRGAVGPGPGGIYVHKSVRVGCKGGG